MPNNEIILTTCPRDCYDACGIAVIKEDGVITRVRGDRNNPVNRGTLCGKCAIAYNGVVRDPNERLNTPLKRVGPKGTGQFAPISWAEAIETTAHKLKEIVASKGPEAIVHAHYSGTMARLAYGFPMRFFNRLGALEVDGETVCNMAGHVASIYTLGIRYYGFDPRTAKDTNSIIVWGANPSATGPHAYKHWLPEAPGKKIVIDPIRTRTAEIADLHLQPFPGSDAALAFAMLHVLKRDGMIDLDFINEHVKGWNEVEPRLDEYTPAWGEAVTDVPAEKIEEAAHIYGEGPSLLWIGQGMQRQPNGGNAFRACAMLPAFTGNFGKPGSGLYYMNFDGPTRGFDDDYIEAAHLRSTQRMAFSQMDLSRRLEAPSDIEALICWNINPAASSPDQKRLHKALAREDLFTVVSDLFQTDTADFADIVLPAASFLEFDDLVTSYFHWSIGPQVKVQDPIGESLPNQEIFRRLAKAMGYEEPELYESDESIIEHLLNGTSFDGGFEALKKVGTVYATPEPIIQFPDLTFPTPSGKIEIASTQAEADGQPRIPQAKTDERPVKNCFRLLSPATSWLMNDSYANETRIAQEMGPASVAIHPDDAADLGLKEGDKAMLSNDTGEIVLNVMLSDRIRQGVVFAYKGRWPKREEYQANVNVLNPGTKTDMGESSSVHGIEVVITPLGTD